MTSAPGFRRVRTAFGDPQLHSVISQGLYLVSVVALNVLIGRYWGSRVRGEVAVVTVLGTLAASIGGIGMWDLMLWGPANGVASRELGRWFRASCVIVVALGLIAGAGALITVPVALALSVVPIALTLHFVRCETWYRLAQGALNSFNSSRLVLPVLSLVAVAVGYALRGHPLWWIAVGQGAAAIVLYRAVPEIGVAGPVSVPRGAAGSVAFHSTIGNALFTSLNRIDIVIVSILASTGNAGVYAIALAAGEAVMVSADGLAFHAAREGAATRALSKRTTRRNFVSTLVIAPLVYVALLLWTRPLLGIEFSDVPRLYALLTPGLMAMAYLRLRLSSDVSAGQGARITGPIAIGLAGMIAFDLALVPAFEATAAAAVSSVAYCLAAALAVRPSRRVAARPA